MKEHLSRPDLHFEFFTSENISFTLVNNSKTVGESPKYWFLFFDLDSLKLIDIPGKEISYIHSKGRVGRNSDLRKYLIKNIRYTGLAGIVCKNCDSGKQYWVYFIHGIPNSGWYLPIDQEKSALVMARFSTHKKLEELLDIVFPKEQRIKF